MAAWATEVGSDAVSGRWQNIDYAWLGQFVWAVVYKPFGAQSIGIYEMMINGFMSVDEMKGDLISEHTSVEKKLKDLHTLTTHWHVC